MIRFRYKQVVEFISRWIVGLVFVFSGFVKAVDPLGLAYKLNDYFDALSFQFLQPLTLVIAILVSALEFTIGLNLIFRNLTRINLRVLLIFMVFFTGLTLWVARANPVSDCGCFGDALVISNWQTFYKNVFLLALSLILLGLRPGNKKVITMSRQWLKAIVFVVFAGGISIHSLMNLPMLDFRPYKTGTNIPEMMTIPPGAPSDEYLTLFYYQKNGNTEEFTEDNYPWQDSTWVFVEMKNELISKGYTPPIHGLSFIHPERGDLTQEILAQNQYTFLLVAPQLKLDKALKIKQRIKDLQQLCIQNNFAFYLLTATSDGSINELKRELDLPLEVLNADEITLKTMIRSNPGLMILKNGTIISKHDDGHIPEIDALKDPLKLSLSQGRTHKIQIYILSLALIFGGLLYVLSKSTRNDK